MVLIHVGWLIHCLGLIKHTAFMLLLETVMVMGLSVTRSPLSLFLYQFHKVAIRIVANNHGCFYIIHYQN